MKRILLIFGLVIISIGTSYSQLNNESNKIIAKAIYKQAENSVYLKWSPSNEFTSKLGMEYGYKIRRHEMYDENGKLYSMGAKLTNAIVLEPNLKPYDESQLQQLESQNDWAFFLNTILYDEMLIPKKENPSLLDAVNAEKAENSKFFLSVLASDKDFEIAKALGNGYVDHQGNTPFESYTYIISINYPVGYIGDKISSAIIDVSSQANQLAAVSKVKGKGANLSASISWNIKQTNRLYTYYNIERSDDGQSFEVVNDEPYIFISAESTDDIYYIDSLPENGVMYYYRVVGLSPFGGFGPPSDVIQVMGVPDRFDFSYSFVIDAIDEGHLTFDWSTLDNQQDNVIQYIDIIRRDNIADKGSIINSTPLSASTRSFDMDGIYGDAYYVVRITDIYGRTYESIKVLGQSPDNTPPEAPINVEGFVRSDGFVQLNWEQNTEDDLLGYKVLYSNGMDDTYSQINGEVIKTNEFVTSLDPEVEVDKIYYKVFAVDDRHNESNASEILTLDRPDLVGPSSPVIRNIVGKEEGIRISWVLSTSEDVVSHTLQRKLRDGSTWSNIITIVDPNEYPDILPMLESEMVPSQYIDAEELSLVWYEYRILAEDDAGNQSASRIKKVLPYDDGIRGVIVDLSILDLSENNSGDQVDGGNNNGAIELSKAQEFLLTWNYDTDFSSSLLEFKIYELTLNDNIPPNQVEQYLENNQNTVRPWITTATMNYRQDPYTGGVVITNVLEEYYYEGTSEKEDGEYKYYKVLAMHRDGGFSEWSEVVAISN